MDIQDDIGPRQLFAALGFGFVHRFLWLVLAAGGAVVVGALVLGWYFEGDITVKAAGILRPRVRHVIKSRLEGIVQEVAVGDGDRVAAGDVLLRLSAPPLRDRLQQLDQELALNDARRSALRAQIESEGRVLEAVVASRQADVASATVALEQVRAEQRIYSERGRPGWKRRPLDELVPVGHAAAALTQARSQLAVAARQLEANAARREELAAEARSRAKLEQERAQLEATLGASVVRAPAAGLVLTRDLDLREGDRVQAGEALLELAVDDGWEAHVLVRQIDRPRVAAGQRVRVFVEAYPHLEYGALGGRVRSVAEQPAAGGGDYPVDVAIDGSPLALADGMAAQVRVSVERGRLLALAWRRLLRELGQAPALRQARG